MHHIVLLDADTLHGADLSVLQLPGCTLQIYPSTTAAELPERLQQATVVISNKVLLDAAMLALAPQLQLVCVAATGTNNVDLAAAAARNIQVCNVQDYALDAVPQHAMALLLALNNQIVLQQQAIFRGDWSRSPVFCLHQQPIQSLAGKMFTVVGYGGLGQATAALARAFGMQVCVAERPDAETIRPGRVRFRDALAQADVLSLHCPAIAGAPPLLGAEQLSWLKPQTLLLNTARGALIDEPALLKALQQHRLAGAALDVLCTEPPNPHHPFLQAQLPNLLLSPHLAWATTESMQRLVGQLAENILAFNAGTPVRTCNIIAACPSSRSC
ncbi:NAD(P)-dependent oxidoreductase [Rheinheimera texasensis]|uniref:NAD(P)-dependent oxidoreductase n=1 Tax=Rheinheimera texasensis TaxID=306205 RepID=UPI0032B137F7